MRERRFPGVFLFPDQAADVQHAARLLQQQLLYRDNMGDGHTAECANLKGAECLPSCLAMRAALELLVPVIQSQFT